MTRKMIKNHPPVHPLYQSETARVVMVATVVAEELDPDPDHGQDHVIETEIATVAIEVDQDHVVVIVVAVAIVEAEAGIVIVLGIRLGIVIAEEIVTVKGSAVVGLAVIVLTAPVKIAIKLLQGMTH